MWFDFSSFMYLHCVEMYPVSPPYSGVAAVSGPQDAPLLSAGGHATSQGKQVCAAAQLWDQRMSGTEYNKRPPVYY